VNLVFLFIVFLLMLPIIKVGWLIKKAV